MQKVQVTGDISRVDIHSRAEVEVLVHTFYARVLEDEVLAPIFEQNVEDWEEHLPLMIQFWESLLFSAGTYQRNPLRKHLPLPLDKFHFETWVRLFIETVDNHFEGPVAEKAKQLAKNISATFQFWMGIATENVPEAIRHYSRS